MTLPLNEHLETTLALLHELFPDITKERKEREERERLAQLEQKQKDSQK